MGIEGFKFDEEPKHLKAIEEAKAGKSLEDHVTNLYDEGGDIDESTGKKIDNSPVVSGADEKLSKRIIKKEDPSADIMGSVPDALPEDPAQVEEWIKKETERLQKQKNNFKKAA